MRRIRLSCRYVVLALALLCGPGLSRSVAADSHASADAGKSTVLLPPAIEAKLKGLMDKARVEKAKVWNVRMTKEIANIVKITGLDDAGSKALEAPAKQAVATAVVDWQDKATDLIRKELMLVPPEMAGMMLDQRLPQIDMFVQADWVEDATSPFEEDDWIKALHKTLTPDQMTAWDKQQTDRTQAIEKQMGDLLKTGADRIHQQQASRILAECNAIELTVGLSKDRSSKLEDLGKSVVDQTSELWRKRVAKMLLSMEDAQRQEFTSNGNIFIGANEDESPLVQSAWTDGLDHLLTADEMTRLKAAREAHRAKRARILGEIMIALLDEKIAFTGLQRQRLEPIASRLMNQQPQLVASGGDSDMNTNCSTELFFSAAGGATDADLKPILDNVQLKRWRHLSDLQDDAAAKPGQDKGSTAENSEPEDIEKAISLFLYQRTQNEQKRVLDTYILKAEDVARVTGLNEEVAATLQAAARGATEETLTTWKWFTEQQVRGQLQEVTPQNVQARLDSLEDYMFFQRSFGLSNPQNIWDETVKVELNPKQQETWKKETDARTEYRGKAIAELIVVKFAALNPISPEQEDKLTPVVAKAALDYGPDIAQIFSPNNPVPWFMQGPYALLPVVGISDDDLKVILSKEQIDRWHGSAECSAITGLWQNIQQMHNQRSSVRVRD